MRCVSVKRYWLAYICYIISMCVPIDIGRVESYFDSVSVVAVVVVEGRFGMLSEDVVQKHSTRTQGDERWDW